MLFALSQLATTIFETVKSMCDFEASLIGFERCTHFKQLEPELNYTNFEVESKKVNDLAVGKAIFEATKLDMITQGKVEFIDVATRYSERSEIVLKDLNFVINPREKIGVIGRSGSGKSSFVKLLWNYLKPCEGNILIDGVDINKCDLKGIRSNMMILSQEANLFEGTLRENIDPLKQADTKKIEAILQRLNFNNKRYEQDGLKMYIEPEGGNLSSGEKQLVCFSRTLINKRKLYIFDEATSNIDLKTEETIQDAVKSEFEESTLIIIAHRIQTIMHCDKILVLDNGSLKEFDTLSNLLKNKDSYFRQIYDAQQKKMNKN